MLLSEAFRCGSAMMLRFTNNVERTDEERATTKVGRVPFVILQLARDFGTPLPDVESGVLAPKQALPLYAALTGFPPKLFERVQLLASQGLLSIERACYLVQHGVWTIPELEGLIASCPYPDLVLDGEIQPESRHLYQHAQILTRTALLGGVLDRALQSRDPSDPTATVLEAKRVKGRIEGAEVTSDKPAGKDVEDDDRDVLIGFDANLTARTYRLGPNENLKMSMPSWQPFAERGTPALWRDGIGQGERLIALLRPRDQAGMIQYMHGDIEMAKNFSRAPSDRIALVVPLDFDDMRVELQTAFIAEANEADIWLMVCPETARTLDGYAREKLNRSRVLPE
jgi:hypothetical protein